MKRKMTMLLFLVLTAVFATACKGSGESGDNVYQVYFLDEEGTGLEKENYEAEAPAKDFVALVSELLARLQREKSGDGLQNPIPPDVEISDFQMKENQLAVYFSAVYNNRTGLEEILSRAAVVKTLCQVPGVDYVEFYVEDQPLMIDGNAVGLMSAESFIESLNDREDKQSKQVTLYFADSAGQKMIGASTRVTYSAAEPLAQLLVEKLIAGPESVEDMNVEDVRPVISSDTTLNTVTIRDNICYLDFSREFGEMMPGVSSDIIVYAIVNTLCELPNVRMVQFTIEGEQREKYGNTENFNTPFERNLDLIAGGAEPRG